MSEIPTGKLIVPLKFDSWCSIFDVGDYYQRLPAEFGIKLDERQSANLKERIHSSSCPCCGNNLGVTGVETVQLSGDLKSYDVCASCGFFRFRTDRGTHDIIDIPFAQVFDATAETPSLVHLSNEIAISPERLYSMDPTNFEVFVGSVLKDFYLCDVHHVGRSGDGGIDLVAIIGERPQLIQVKRRTRPSPSEGIDTVKLLFASAYSAGSNDGIVVTTAQSFSKDAQRWIRNERLHETRFNMSLLNVNDLLSMVNAVRKPDVPQPWEVHQSSNVETPVVTTYYSGGTTPEVSSPTVKILEEDIKETSFTWRGVRLADAYVLEKTSDNYSKLWVWRDGQVHTCIRAEIELKHGERLEFSSFDTFIAAFLQLRRPIVELCNNTYFRGLEEIPPKLLEALFHHWEEVYPDVVFDLARWSVDAMLLRRFLSQMA